MRLALLALLLAAPAPAAGDAMPPAAFEALAEGHMLHFTLDGAPFGAEQYFPGRRSLWRFADGTCAAGPLVRRRATAICFRLRRAARRPVLALPATTGRAASTAALVEDGAGTGFVPRARATSTEKPLACPGPDVGS